MRSRWLVSVPFVLLGWLIACGSDAVTQAPHDAGADSSYDATPDTYKPVADAAPGEDAADSAQPLTSCNPYVDASVCPGVKLCCQIAGTSPDGGPNFVCVLPKPPNGGCPIM